MNRRHWLIFPAIVVACAAPSVETTLLEGPHQSNVGLDWRDQIIYQVLTDRFENGDPSNDIHVEPRSFARHHGGDWQGIIDRLDYIEALGATAIWLSPVVRNVEEDAGFSSYHGYWTQDFVRANPHFGDIFKLRELVDTAHARGLVVILDVVTNHVGQLFYYDINGNGRPDESLSGGGTPHTCVQVCGADRQNPICKDTSRTEPERVGCRCSADENLYCEKSAGYFERILEADPEYDPRGVQGWTSLGFSGPAEIRFPYMPEIDRTPPQRPPEWFRWPADRAWFDDPTWYHRRGRVYSWWHEGEGYSRDFLREQETLGDFPGGLKDLATEHPDVREALIRAFEMWVTLGDFDGFRIDTLKHIDRPEVSPNERGFWGEFATRMRAHAKNLGKQNFFMFGEAFDGDDELIGAYTLPGKDELGPFQRLDSVFYFSQKYRVIDAVLKRGEPTKNIHCMLSSRFGTNPEDTWCREHGYPIGPTYFDRAHATSEDGGIGLAPNRVLVNFLDNHDLARFLYEESSVETLHLALFFLLTWDGIPCIYYGTEQRFAGGNDPRNREDMAAGNPTLGYLPFDRDNPTFAFVRAMNQTRRQHASLRRGDVRVRWATERTADERDAGLFAFERAIDGEVALVLLNVSREHQSTTCAPEAEGGACMTVDFPPGTLLTDIGPWNDGVAYRVANDGTLEVPVRAQTGRILVPAQ